MMLRAIYVVPLMHLETSQSLGVKKKIYAQVEAFQFHGVDTTIVDSMIEHRPPPFWAQNEFSFLVKLLRLPFKRIYQYFRRARYKKDSFPMMLKKIGEERNVVVYLRHGFLSPRVIHFYYCLARLPNVRYIYLEIPTWPYDKEPEARLYGRVLRILLKHVIDKIVTFSKYNIILGVPTVRITNGIAINDIPVSQPPPVSTGRVLIVVAASLNAWVGIDRLLRGLAIFLNQSNDHPNIQIIIAGSGPYFHQWRSLSQKLGLTEIVHFNGKIEGSELDEIFLHADFAIGNLANHRRGLPENADLKNREYCARGIPFVISGSDEAFPESFPFIHRVKADNGALNIQSLLDFYAQLKMNYPDFRNQLRQFAERNLDWKVVLSPIVADMKNVMDD